MRTVHWESGLQVHVATAYNMEKSKTCPSWKKTAKPSKCISPGLFPRAGKHANHMQLILRMTCLNPSTQRVFQISSSFPFPGIP